MSGSSGSNLNRGDADPFSHLHKMSTTAGLGSGDYVAISGTAIAAILAGVASSLVLFNNLVFLVVPLVGVVAAVLAFKQISQSNGTQTGREVAAIGLLLSLGFGGFYSVKTIYTAVRHGSDEDQVVATVRKLGDLVSKKNYSAAYALFDDRFKRRVSMTQFESGWQQVSASPILGGVQGMDWNHVLPFDTDPVNNDHLATGMMLLKAKPTEPLRISMAFRNDGSGWLIDQIPQIYPDAPPPTAGPSQSKGGASNQMGPPRPK